MDWINRQLKTISCIFSLSSPRLEVQLLHRQNFGLLQPKPFLIPQRWSNQQLELLKLDKCSSQENDCCAWKKVKIFRNARLFGLLTTCATSGWRRRNLSMTASILNSGRKSMRGHLEATIQFLDDIIPYCESKSCWPLTKSFFSQSLLWHNPMPPGNWEWARMYD